MKQKGELKVLADSDVAQSGVADEDADEGATVVLDSKHQLGDQVHAARRARQHNNRDTGDFRAIKEIPIRDVPVARLQAVQTEIEVLHTMQHEKIVHYFETIRTDSHLYLARVHGDRQPRRRRAQVRLFPEALVAMYVRQVLLGLEWLHRQGVCHRDIKGANLLITKHGQIKLADFGVARRVEATTDPSVQSTAVVGTPYWMAPEVIQMSGFTTASDIWSLGCTILELLRREPYYDRPITALYRSSRRTSRRSPPGSRPSSTTSCASASPASPSTAPPPRSSANTIGSA